METSISTSLLLLAADADQAAPPACGSGFLLSMVAVMFLFWFILMRPQQREQKRRQELLKALKPNDHVVTIGGIHGVVTNVHEERDIVTIRVDDKNDTKIRVLRSAIARIVGDEPTTEQPK